MLTSRFALYTKFLRPKLKPALQISLGTVTGGSPIPLRCWLFRNVPPIELFFEEGFLVNTRNDFLSDINKMHAALFWPQAILKAISDRLLKCVWNMRTSIPTQ